MQSRLPFYTLLSAVFCGVCLPMSVMFWCQRGVPPMPWDVKAFFSGVVFVATLIVSGLAQFLFTRETWSVSRQNITLLLVVSYWYLPFMALALFGSFSEKESSVLFVLSGAVLGGLVFCWPAVGAIVARRFSTARPGWSAFRYLLAGGVQLALVLYAF
ncbi:MAG: hypothetical protein Q4F40_05805 [Akkermansia sp.]|nr:hypothetical protein [Akkermansia sp.]